MQSRLFAIAFILAAFVVALWMVQHIPHSVVLHINQRWHVSLAGEQDLDNIHFDQTSLWPVRQIPHEIWLEGQGRIQWRQQQIQVHDLDLQLGTHRIEISNPRLEVDLTFYPDGRVTKGQAVLK